MRALAVASWFPSFAWALAMPLHAEPHNRSIYEPVYGAPKKEWVLSASDPVMVAAHGRRLLAKA